MWPEKWTLPSSLLRVLTRMCTFDGPKSFWEALCYWVFTLCGVQGHAWRDLKDDADVFIYAFACVIFMLLLLMAGTASEVVMSREQYGGDDGNDDISSDALAYCGSDNGLHSVREFQDGSRWLIGEHFNVSIYDFVLICLNSM